MKKQKLKQFYIFNKSLVYKAKVVEDWALCQEKEILKIFNSENDLVSFWIDYKNGINEEPYTLQLEIPPYIPEKIGNIYFEEKFLKSLKSCRYIKKFENHFWCMKTNNGSTIAKFKTVKELDDWEWIFREWRYQIKLLEKKIAFEDKTNISHQKQYSETLARKNKTTQRKKIKKSIKSNLTITDSYTRMKKDIDWWREQS